MDTPFEDISFKGEVESRGSTMHKQIPGPNEGGLQNEWTVPDLRGLIQWDREVIPLRLSVLLCLLVLFQCPLPVRSASWESLAVFHNGSGENSLTWSVVDGAIPAGFLQGPSAFLPLPGGRLLLADTLGFSLRELDESGRTLRRIALEPLAKRAGLAEPPLVMDLARVPSGGYALADAANNVVLFVTEDGDFVRTVRSDPARAEFRQINRIHMDGRDYLYLVDLAVGRCLVFDPRGQPVAELKGFSVFAVDRFGNIIHPLFTGDVQAREIAVFGPDGEKEDILGIVREPERILYIDVLGFDAAGGLFLWLETDAGTVVQRVDPATRQVERLVLPAVDPGLDMAATLRLGPDGILYTVKVSPAEFSLLRFRRDRDPGREPDVRGGSILKGPDKETR